MRRRITRHVAVAGGVGVVDECGHDGLDGAVLDELLDQHVDAIDVEEPEAVEQQQGGVVFATVVERIGDSSG